MERLSPKKLNEMEGKEQYCVEVSSRFTALEYLDTEFDISSVSLLRSISTFQPKGV
jgi:hypothetical protein